MTHFSILHVSDLHRDATDEVDNPSLLESLERDVGEYGQQDPKIPKPALCIVSGDLVRGVKPGISDGGAELTRQYAQAEEFLVGMADRFFDGDRNRIILLPGNHDVGYDDVMGSVSRIAIPADPLQRIALVTELFKPKSRLRWSWSELCFFRITDEDRYRDRFRYFAATYDRFYQGRRTFLLAPDQQYGVFDFHDLGFCVLALNSCYDNDPLHKVGAFNPTSVTEGSRALRATERTGWLAAAAWHHNLSGAPTQDDRLDVEVLQLLIDAGVSLGFHGHQHLPDCVEERYRIGPSGRKMTIVSASTLCAGPDNLSPGVPRSYNVVELDTGAWSGRVHQRQMVNRLFNLPVWGPGHFIATNQSYVDFDLSKPLADRPAGLDLQLAIEQADKLLGSHNWSEAAELLGRIKDAPVARPLLLKALGELGDSRRTMAMLWPPLTNGEAVAIGGAILESGTTEQAEAFLHLDLVCANPDASVRDMSRRVQQRRSK